MEYVLRKLISLVLEVLMIFAGCFLTFVFYFRQQAVFDLIIITLTNSLQIIRDFHGTIYRGLLGNPFNVTLMGATTLWNIFQEVSATSNLNFLVGAGIARACSIGIPFWHRNYFGKGCATVNLVLFGSPHALQQLYEVLA